jgi:hypothetical protein
MNGVEILSTAEVVTESTCNWWLAGFAFFGTIVFCAILGYVLSDKDFFISVISGVAGILLGVFVWAVATSATYKPVAYETHYKVTIDDAVSMNDFMEKYEILEQDGKIYIVREREQ